MDVCQLLSSIWSSRWRTYACCEKNDCLSGNELWEKAHRFSPVWFSGHQWLEYSESRDAAFCFLCHKMRTFLVAYQQCIDAVFTHHVTGKRISEAQSISCLRNGYGFMEKCWRTTAKGKRNKHNDKRRAARKKPLLYAIHCWRHILLGFKWVVLSWNYGKWCIEHIDDDLPTQDLPCGLFIKLFHYTLMKDAKFRIAFTKQSPKMHLVHLLRSKTK